MEGQIIRNEVNECRGQGISMVTYVNRKVIKNYDKSNGRERVRAKS